MKQLVAIKEVWYGGSKRVEGDEFEASDIDAVILCAHDVTGGARAVLKSADQPAKAKPAPKVEAQEPKVEVQKAEIKAEELPNPLESATAGRPRVYRRRDMTPQE